MHIAMLLDSAKGLKVVTKLGAKMNVPYNAALRKPLHAATDAHKLSFVKLMLKLGADANVVDAVRCTHIALLCFAVLVYAADRTVKYT